MLNARKIYFYDFPLYFLRRDNMQSSVRSGEKVHAIFGEYAFIEELIYKRLDEFRKYLPAFYWKKYKSYFFNLKRIDQRFKLPFLERFAAEFRLYQERGSLDLLLFDDVEKDILEKIIRSPTDFLQDNIERLGPQDYLKKQKSIIDQCKKNRFFCKNDFKKEFNIPVFRLAAHSFKDRIRSILFFLRNINI